MLMSKGLAIKDEVRGRYQLEADRRNMLALSHTVLVVMAEQVQTRLHRSQYFVYRRFSGIDSPRRPRSANLFEYKRSRSLVCKKNVDTPQLGAGADFFVHEMTTLVVLGGCPALIGL